MSARSRLLAAILFVFHLTGGCATIPEDEPQPSCTRGEYFRREFEVVPITAGVWRDIRRDNKETFENVRNSPPVERAVSFPFWVAIRGAMTGGMLFATAFIIPLDILLAWPVQLATIPGNNDRWLATCPPLPEADASDAGSNIEE